MNSKIELEHDGALEEDYEDEDIGETTLTPAILPLLSDMPTLNHNNGSTTAAAVADTTATDDDDQLILDWTPHVLKRSCTEPENYFRTHGHHFGHAPPGYEHEYFTSPRKTSGPGHLPKDGGISGFGVIAVPAADQFIQSYASTTAAAPEEDI